MNKTKIKSLTLNFIMNSVLTMSSFIFPLITFPYVSRILLPEGLGKVSFATSVISYFSLLARLGIPTYGIRACAQVRDNKEALTKTVQEIFIINLIMSVFTYLIFFIFLFTVPRLQQDKTLFIIMSATIIFDTIGVEWLYKAMEQYTYITIRSVAFKLIALFAMIIFVNVQSDYVIYGAVSIFATSASSILNFINARKYIGMKHVDSYDLKKHVKLVLIFFAMACATTVYTNLDTVMLGFIKTDTDVGYYSAAVKIKSILVSIVTSLGVVLLPRSTYYMENGLSDEFLRITKKALNFVILVATPLVIYFMLFAKEGIYFLSGDAYNGSIVPMQIIMPTVLLIGVTNVMGIQMLIPLGKEKNVLCSVIAGGIINIIINSILIPQMSAAGAAIGTIIAEIVVLIVQYYYTKDMVLDIFKKIHYLSIICASLAGVMLSFWVKYLNLSSLITLVISGLLFFGAYTVVLAISKEPLILEFILKLYNNKRRPS